MDEGIEVAWNQYNVADDITPERLQEQMEIFEVLSTLSHENIVKIFDFWYIVDARQLVIITELMTSGTLKEFVFLLCLLFLSCFPNLSIFAKKLHSSQHQEGS